MSPGNGSGNWMPFAKISEDLEFCLANHFGKTFLITFDFDSLFLILVARIAIFW